MLTVQVGHSTGIALAAFTPDGRQLVTTPGSGAYPTGDRFPLVWDVETGRELRRLGAYHQNFISALAITQIGDWVLTGSWAGDVYCTQLRTGMGWPGPSGLGGILGIGAAPDGASYVVVDTNGYVIRYSWQTGEVLQSFEVGPVQPLLQTVVLTSDASWLLVGDAEGFAHLWNVAAGELLVSFNVGSEVYGLALAPDGGWVAAGTQEGYLYQWEAPFDEEALAMNIEGDASFFRMSPAGDLLLVFDNEAWDTDAWSVDDEDMLGSIDGMPLAISPDGGSVLSTPFSKHEELYTNTVLLHKVEDGEPFSKFQGLVSPLTSLASTSDRRLLVSGDIDGILHVWDTRLGAQVLAAPLKERVGAVGFSADDSRFFACVENFGAFFAFGGDSQQSGAPAVQHAKTIIWEANELLSRGDGGRPFRKRAVVEVDGRVAALFPDGKQVATGDAFGVVRLWDVDSGKATKTMITGDSRVTSIALSQDGKRLAAGFESGLGVVFGVADGRELQRVGGAMYVELDATGEKLVAGDGWQSVTVYRVGGPLITTQNGAKGLLSPDGSHFAGILTTGIGLWKADTFEYITGSSDHLDNIEDFGFSSDSRHLWTAAKDGAIMVYDVEKRQTLARLVSFYDRDAEEDLATPRGDWAVHDSYGRFDASNGGEVEGLHWVFGTEVIHLDQLKDEYYEPGLLSSILSSTDALREVVDINSGGIELPPDVEILQQPSESSGKLRFKLSNRGGGIGAVAVLVNGREFTGDAREAGFDPDVDSTTLEVDLSSSPHFVPGAENTVEVIPSNDSGGLKGRGGRVRVKRPKSGDDAPPRFFAVIAGVSSYNGEGIRLRYASKDAADFGAAIQRAAAGFFDEDKVDVQVLHDEGKPATRANLIAALEKLKQSRSTDTVLLYLAGHGVSHADEYYYLTQDAESLDLPSDKAKRESLTLSGEELATWLNRELPALKVVLILDTCHSGQLISDMAQTRGADSSRKRALERLKDRTATYLLAGSASDQPSYESTPYGQGLLTYSLLLGMKGEALREGSYVDVQQLFGYAQDRVPQLAREVRGIQQPQIAMPRGESGGGSFDIGRLKAADRDAIPLAQKRPMVMKTDFQAEGRAIDELGLEDIVDEAMRTYSADAPKARFLFVDGDTVSGAFLVSGIYSTNGDDVKLKLFVYQGKELVTGPIEISGSKADFDPLVKRVLSEVAGSVDSKDD